MSEILIRGAMSAEGERTSVLVRDGRIAAVTTGAEASSSPAAPEDAEIIEAEGLRLLPGLVDLHVHLREPGFTASETVLTGTRAAAAGGFTTVFAMPNTSPVQDTAGVVEQVLALGERAGLARVQPIGAVTRGQEGETLAAIGGMAGSRARVRVFSDDGRCVSDALVMRRALEYVKAFDGVIAQHAQEPRLTEGATMNEGPMSATLGITGWPSVAEEAIIARDVLLAEYTDSRLHFCHVSTAGSVDLIRYAKARGIKVTAEVTPHHLLLTDDLAEGFDARFKVNPPLRRAHDVEALREGVADGTIDIIATDHAPHPDDHKCIEWQHAAFGMVGLESALSVVVRTLIEPGHIGWADVPRLMSAKPAEIGRLPEAGRPIAVGEPADLVLVDERASRVFGAEHLHGKGRNSPFLGIELPAAVHTTIYDGRITFADGRVREGGVA